MQCLFKSTVHNPHANYFIVFGDCFIFSSTQPRCRPSIRVKVTEDYVQLVYRCDTVFRPPDIYLGRLIIYHGFFLFLLLSFFAV